MKHHGRLDRRVQREDAGAIADVANQFHDLADLLGAFAKPLDTLGGFLHLVAHRLHALDGAGHGAGAMLGVDARLFGDGRG